MRGRWERVSDFIQAGVEAGLAAFEVSGLHIDTFYDEIRPGHLNIVSFHNPAPPQRGQVAMSGKARRQADLVLTSLDQERRQQALSVVKHCLDVASEYGAQAVVLHLGNTSADPNLENQLKHLYLTGRITSLEADALRARLLSERALGRADRLSALRRSLDELIPYASSRCVRLGLENRPICETPNWQDMDEILAWYPDDYVGYWHDTGHAQVQENLGITPHADWLRAYGHRLVGLHLHDAVGCEVHRAPGTGSVDWAGLAARVAWRGDNIVRTVEVNHAVSEEALRAGVEHLRSTGWAQE
jgi:sugar phosphate isomerase/epimerase